MLLPVMDWWNQDDAASLAPTSGDWVRVMQALTREAPEPMPELSGERRAKALRLLEEATRQLIRAGAGMQGKGADTAPLTKPAVIMGEVIRLLHDE